MTDRYYLPDSPRANDAQDVLDHLDDNLSPTAKGEMVELIRQYRATRKEAHADR